MKRKQIITITIIGGFLLFTPLIAYYYHFKNYSLSMDSQNWANFGEYLNGTFMPIIALVGVLVTLILGLISEERNDTNIQIEQQKQRPLLHIEYYDGQERVEIYMKNKGNGPLIISNYNLINTINDKAVPSLYDILPSIPREYYDNNTGNQNNVVLSINETKCLLLLQYKIDEDIETFVASVELIREKIKNYKIVVEYKDVYDRQMPKYERSLIWFGRHTQALPLTEDL